MFSDGSSKRIQSDEAEPQPLMQVVRRFRKFSIVRKFVNNNIPIQNS